MVHLLEFHGRVSRPDGRPPTAGVADLHVALHPERVSEQVLWEDTLRGVEVATGGYFHVLLGEIEPIDHAVFDGGARWVSVRGIKGGRVGDELCERIPVLGVNIRLAREVEQLSSRVAGMENAVDPGPARAVTRKLGKRTVLLHRRLRRIEDGGGPVTALLEKIAALDARIGTLDGEDGRLMRIEDELEDVVGPDGDIIDLLERIERLEGKGPVPERGIPTLTPAPKLTPHVIERLDGFERRLGAIETRPPAPLPSADALHVVKRGGDTMTGGLTINRGGLDVLSGGIKCRGADVNSLEATLFVKAPKLIGDALEVRGDITVDSTKRTLQIRHIEGRAGSGRKDGGLVLNGRSGSTVEVGSEEAPSEGLVVHGPVRATQLSSTSSAMAVVFQSGGDFHVGEVVGVNDHGHLIHLKDPYDPRAIGIVGENPAVLLGVGPEKKVVVVVAGVTRCKVDAAAGAIRAGDLLVAGAARGFAQRVDDPARAFGAVVAKAMLAHADGQGEIPVLVMSR